jgi:HTH-type transcriptional regulator/antitoxin HipB
VFVQYPIETGRQLAIVLKALRQSRQLTQAELGVRLGVNQKRIARIEAEPGVTSFDQIARMVALMGHRIVLEEIPPPDKPPHVAENTPTW